MEFLKVKNLIYLNFDYFTSSKLSESINCYMAIKSWIVFYFVLGGDMTRFGYNYYGYGEVLMGTCLTCIL